MGDEIIHIKDGIPRFRSKPRQKTFGLPTGRLTRAIKPRVRSKRNYIFIPAESTEAF